MMMRNPEMPVDPIDRAAAVAVAADYEALQGLIAMALGVGLIWMTVPPNPALGAVWIALGVVFGQGYYHKKYGAVRQQAGKRWGSVGAAILVVVLGAAGIVVDVFWPLPIQVGALVVSAALLLFFRLNYRHVGVTWIHYGAAAVVALGALLPLTGWFTPGGQWRIDCVLLGLAFIVIGAVDHQRLTRAMKTVTDD